MKILITYLCDSKTYKICISNDVVSSKSCMHISMRRSHTRKKSTCYVDSVQFDLNYQLKKNYKIQSYLPTFDSWNGAIF